MPAVSPPKLTALPKPSVGCEILRIQDLAWGAGARHGRPSAHTAATFREQGPCQLILQALQAVLALRELVARATRIALRRAVEDVAFADDVRGCPETVPVGA